MDYTLPEAAARRAGFLPADPIADLSPYGAYRSAYSPDSRYFAYQNREGIYVVDIQQDKTTLVKRDPNDSETHDAAVQFIMWIPVP